jgi:hypothetical protein
MIVPWPFVVALAAPISIGLVYGVAIKVSGRSISLRLLVFEIGALLFLILGWIVLAASGPGTG